MKNWDDDYSYHSSSHGSQVDIEGEVASLSSVHELPANLSSSNPDSSSAAESSASSPYHTCTPSSAVSSINTPTYFFGEGTTGRLVNQSSGGSSESSFSHTRKNPPHSIPPPPPSPARPCDSPSKLDMSRSKTTGHHDDKASPTKKLAWDRGMINSLVSTHPA